MYDRVSNRMFRRVWCGRASAWLIAGAVALAVAATAAWGNLTPEVESDFFFSESDPQLRASLELDARFPSPPQIVVRVEDTGGEPEAEPGAHRAAYHAAIESLTRAFESTPGITGAYSITTDDPSRSPLFGRILLTADERATNLILLSDGTAPEVLLPALEAVVDAHRTPDLDIVLSGVPVIVEQIRRNLFRDLVVFSTAALLLFGFLVGGVYRSLPIVAGTLLSCLAACALTLLTLEVLGIAIGLLTANLITIVFVLTLSHIVFLTANWRRAASQDESPHAAVPAGVAATLKASFWCMTTTLLGFLSLLVASAEPLRELGVAGAVGTLIALGVAYALFPAFLWRARALPVEPVAPGTVASTGRHGYGVLAAAAALLGVLALGVARVDTDPGLLTYFAPGSELREGLERIDADGGSSTLKVAIRDAGGGRLDSESVHDRMGALQGALEEDPAVGVVLSPWVLLGHARLQPLARFMSLGDLLDIAESPQLDRVALSYVTPERDQGLFLLRMREGVSEASRTEVMDRVRTAVTTAGLEPVTVGGLYDLQAQLGRLIAQSLAIGLGGLMVLFAGVARTVSGSTRISTLMLLCLSAIPLTVLGTFGYLGIAVDIITSPAANVALAMGVDSMIHLVVRARALTEITAEPTASWIRARRELARPILSATAIICAGFGIFALSTFPPTQRFGFAVILGTLTAAAMALVVLPRAVRTQSGSTAIASP